MSRRIIALFVLVNFAAIVLIAALVIFPTSQSLSNGRRAVSAQQARYNLESRFLAEYEDNLRELDALGNRRLTLSYDELMIILAEVGQLAQSHNLAQLELRASAPMNFYTQMTEFDRLFEMRVRASYEGAPHEMMEFIYQLEKSFASIISFNINADSAEARLDVEFSLIGSY